MTSIAVILTAVGANDLDALTELRVDAMRPSLERIGRFDPQRSRERFRSGFDPAWSRHIEVDGMRVGFVVVKPDEAHNDAWLLDHLYLQPGRQGQGIGSAVLARLFAEADAARKHLRVGALRGSDANRFYQRHGFVPIAEAEWDIYYLRRVGCRVGPDPSATMPLP